MAIIDDRLVLEDVSSAMPGDFLALMKPRVMSLVVFTGLVGLYLAPGAVNPVIGVIAILCIAIGAGASGALNMWYDADIDAVMARTVDRPIPGGRVSADAALAFGLILSAFSVATLGLIVNWLSASLLAFTIFFYAVIYTMWLKRSTPQNIVIGGAAGALPPMIGWAAAANAVSIEPVVLFAIIFFWTPPHFWALSLFKSGDYARAGIPMMPNVHGNAATQRQIFVYALILVAFGLLPWIIGFGGPVYGIVSAVLGAGFLRHSLAVLRMDPADTRMVEAKRLFGFSILYLFALFATLLGEAVIRDLVGAM